jgi:hypothetical protein
LAANAARERARHVEAQARHPDALAPRDGTAATPEDEALAREDRELLRRALADVPDEHRETLVLYYMEGQSVAAIATALGIREDLVKQRLSRGRRALRDGVNARVENALARARTGPAFRAGVVTAIVASGARETQAATAGKAIAMLTTKKMVVAGAAALLVAGGTAVWIGARARADQSKPPAAAAPMATTTAPSAASSAAAQTSAKVRKIGKTEREQLIASIKAAQQRRASAAPRPSASSSPGTRLAPNGDGDMDKEYIRASVKELLPLLQDCYEQALDAHPPETNLDGSIVVEFTIEGEPGVGGVVSESAVDDKESTLADASVRECIQETMYALEIDPPAGGGSVHVRYPFSFRRVGPPN